MGSLVEQSIFFLLPLSLIIGSSLSLSHADSCKHERCSRHGPLIRFPFRINDSRRQSERCGYPGFDLYCKDDYTFIQFPLLGRDVVVDRINYEDQTLTIVADKNCLWNLLLTSSNFTSSRINPDSWTLYTLVNCSKIFDLWKDYRISCLSDAEHGAFIFADGDSASVAAWPVSCQPIKTISVPRLYPFNLNLMSATQLTENNISEMLRSSPYRDYGEVLDGLSLVWYVPGCIDCERSGNNCGYRDNNSSETLCSPPRPHKGITT